MEDDALLFSVGKIRKVGQSRWVVCVWNEGNGRKQRKKERKEGRKAGEDTFKELNDMVKDTDHTRSHISKNAPPRYKETDGQDVPERRLSPVRILCIYQISHIKQTEQQTLPQSVPSKSQLHNSHSQSTGFCHPIPSPLKFTITPRKWLVCIRLYSNIAIE